MVHAAVCLEREVVIEVASVDEVISFCKEAQKEMRLKIKKEQSTRDGKTTIFVSQGALVPLVLKAVLLPLSPDEYVKTAQRSGLHVIISPSKEGIHVHSCGVALDEVTGKLTKYAKDEFIEEVTDTMEALDFENKFIKRILEHFPKTRQI